MARLEIYVPDDEYREYLENCATNNEMSVSKYLRYTVELHQESLRESKQGGESE